MAIVTAAEVARVLDAKATDNDLLDQLIVAAQAAVETFCDRKFENAEVTEYHDGRGVRFMRVLHPPITDDAGVETRDPDDLSIWDDDDREYTATTKIDPEDIIIANPATGLIVLDGLTFLDDVNNVKLTYHGGYSAAGMPEDVKQAVILLVQQWYIHRSRRLDRVGGAGPLEDVTELSGVSLPGRVVNLLEPFQLSTFATGYEGA